MTVEPRASANLIHDKVAVWMDTVIRTDEFRKFKRDAIAYTIYQDDPEYLRPDRPRHFAFSPGVTLQHDLIMSYYHLSSSLEGLKQMEYYFKRYPFAGTPVARTDHIRNMCEMYFNHFYMFRERLKVVLKSLNAIIAPARIDVGKIINAYDKEFDQELRERHGVHHRSSFDDVGIDRVHLTEVIAMSSEESKKHWRGEHLSAYRKTSREWSERARRRALTVAMFDEVVAGAILEHTTFLDEAKPG